MRLSITAAAAILATGVVAAPAPGPNPWCTRPGQPCGRAPEPTLAPRVPEPEANPDPWCTRPGQPCGRSPKAEPNPDPWCTRPGQPCARNAEPTLVARVPEPAPWCTRPGQPCARTAAPVAGNVARAPVDNVIETLANVVRSEGDLLARDADPEPWCHRPGQPCARAPSPDMSNAMGGAAWSAKRAIADLVQLVGRSTGNPEQYVRDLSLEEEVKRSAEPEADPWCRRPGQPCARSLSDLESAHAADKRWCRRPGQPCARANVIARAIIDSISDEDIAKRDASGALETIRNFARKIEAM
ncbi:fungal zn(2)-Cys(6) binuclear cluster domain-containing protein [Purpureocillium lavendulum]|uniref:Fungal zn(2)-Cys(6) binuclear cluster domain-containing protein n=1 Tax=Purpureocillium lavendulum TaxID=1247861 RepID=A0AB34G0E6_9HYPO|nr:fungal zn(2)-Cys(6) binuclear cluster domain-containing protein [Purpureocillium lavendulum]